MKLQVSLCLVMVAVVGLVASTAGEEAGRVYCGRMLAQKLAMLCYSSDNLVKRGGYGAGPQFGEYSWWLEPARAQELRARGKRQVVQECCDKPCTIPELLSYC